MTSKPAGKPWWQDRALRALAARLGLFVAVALGVQLVIFLWFRHTAYFRQHLAVPETLYIPWLAGLSRQNLISAALFITLMFVVFQRKSLLRLPLGDTRGKCLLWAALAAASLLAHYLLKAWLSGHLDAAAALPLLFAVLKLSLVGLFLVFLFLACLGTRFVGALLFWHWRSVAAFAAIGAAYLGALLLFQQVWFGLSVMVSHAIRFLLDIFYDDVSLSVAFGEPPVLGAGGFVVGISKVCSGVDSLLLFLSLYIFIGALNWKALDKRRYFLLFIPGVIGAVLYNILRVFAILIIGIEYSQEFAIDTFHTNAGWIMFLLFFAAFWHFGSGWIFKKKATRANRGA